MSGLEGRERGFEPGINEVQRLAKDCQRRSGLWTTQNQRLRRTELSREAVWSLT